MKKTFKVVMLGKPDYKTNITKRKDQLFFIEDRARFNNGFNQQLYIISDNEIKEGDWCIGNGLLVQVTREQARLNNVEGYQLNFYYKKVIATTDKSLGNYEWTASGQDFKQLSQIPESFIKAYVKAYNEGKSIIEVDLETGIFNTINYIKTRLDNTVIIHQSKTYTRDEVSDLLTSLNNIRPSGLSSYELVKWLEENL